MGRGSVSRLTIVAEEDARAFQPSREEQEASAMLAISTMFSAAAAIGAITNGAPASAQYSVFSTAGGDDDRTQISINRCAEAVQAQLGRNRYGNGAADAYSAPRVLGISSVERQSNGGSLAVTGVATSGRYVTIAEGARRPVDLIWRCTSDDQGAIKGINIFSGSLVYGVGTDTSARSYKGEDYSQYGYRRY